MPPKLKRLSGDDVVKVFSFFGFSIHSQKGSHIKLRRITVNLEKQSLTIPRHKEIDCGTLRAILRQASRFIPEQELIPYFYSE